MRQYCYGTNYAKHEISKIAFAKQLYVQQMADEGADIASNDANDKVHTASVAFAAHDAVGNVAYKNTCQYRPSREISYML